VNGGTGRLGRIGGMEDSLGSAARQEARQRCQATEKTESPPRAPTGHWPLLRVLSQQFLRYSLPVYRLALPPAQHSQHR
jgi:hypothetical protein